MSETPEPRSFADRALVQLTLVRFREFYREPEALFWVFIFPILLAAGLGLAFRNRPADVIRVGVASSLPDTGATTRALSARPGLAPQVLDDSAGARALRIGRIALLVLPADSGRVGYRFDDTRPESRMARFLVDDALQRAAGREDRLQPNEQLIREPGSRYIDFVLPGLLGMNLMGSGIWGIGFAVVDARRKRLLKRLIATPMSKSQYLASFLLSRLTMLVLEVVLLLGFGVLVFGVPLRGSLTALAVICLLASMAFGGLGLLVAARPSTIEGASGLMNLVMLPMWIFSGVFFSAGNFPAAVQPVIRALPLTAVNDALRANMLEGAGLRATAPQLAIITAWLVVCFAVALRIFKWK